MALMALMAEKIDLVPFTEEDIFRKEGVKRDSFVGSGGEYWSEVIMSILSPEDTR